MKIINIYLQTFLGLVQIRLMTQRPEKGTMTYMNVVLNKSICILA